MKKRIILFTLMFFFLLSSAKRKKMEINSIQIIRTTLIMNTIVALDCDNLQNHYTAYSFYVKNLNNKKMILKLVGNLKPTINDSYDTDINSSNNKIDARAKIIITYKGKKKIDVICLNASIILLNGVNMNCNYDLINYIYNIPAS